MVQVPLKYVNLLTFFSSYLLVCRPLFHWSSWPSGQFGNLECDCSWEGAGVYDASDNLHESIVATQLEVCLGQQLPKLQDQETAVAARMPPLPLFLRDCTKKLLNIAGRSADTCTYTLTHKYRKSNP